MITGAGLTWKHGIVHIGTKQYVFKQQRYIALLLDTGHDLFVCFGRTESGVENYPFGLPSYISERCCTLKQYSLCLLRRLQDLAA